MKQLLVMKPKAIKKRKYEKENQFQARAVRSLSSRLTKLEWQNPFPETKRHVAATGSFAVGVNGTVMRFTGIAQGDSESLRDGNTIFLKALNVRFIMNNATAATHTTVRFIIFADRNTDGASPGVQDVLETDTIIGLKNWANRSRFVVLHDRVYDNMYQNASGLTANDLIYGHIYLKLNWICQFLGSTTADADSGPGQLYGIVIGAHATDAYADRFTVTFSDQ